MPSSTLYPAQCALLEGRTNLLDGPGNGGSVTCDTLQPTTCRHFYTTSGTDGELFTLCDSADGGPCVAGDTISCSLPSGVAHVAALRQQLSERVAAMHAASSFHASSSRLSVAALLAEAAIAIAEEFELGVARDAELPTAAIEAMLRAQLESGTSPHGWADGPFTLQQIAAQLPRDELSGTIAVLEAEIAEADARLHEAQAHAQQQLLLGDAGSEGAASTQGGDTTALPPVRVTGPRVRTSSRGYLVNGSAAEADGGPVAGDGSGIQGESSGVGGSGSGGEAGPPLFVAGFNSAGNLLNVNG